MRLAILASAALLAACQPGSSMTNDGAPSSARSGSDAIDANQDAPGNADAPVSSDGPQPTPAPEPDRPTPDCPITASSDWHAHVDAMPGPNDNPRLIVTGKVTVPTGGYKVSLRMGQVAESYPVQVTVYLDAVPPSGPATQALETHEVRGSWKSEERVGSVTVRCGSRSVARLSSIETAR